MSKPTQVATLSPVVYITSIEINNLGGIRHFKGTFGQIAIIVGRNGAGKTTILEVIKNFFEGGGNPDLVSDTADSGNSEIHFSNGYWAKKELRRDGFDLQVYNPGGGRIKQEATYLKELAPGISFDPVKFIDMDPRERSTFLLDTLALMFDHEEVNEAAGEKKFNKQVSLQELNGVRGQYYLDREEIGRDVTALKGTIKTLSDGILPDDGTNWAKERQAAQDSVTSIEGRIRTVQSDAAATATRNISAAKLTAEREESEAKAETQRQIDALREALATKITGIQAKRDGVLERIANERLEQVSRDAAGLYSELEVANQRLGEVRSKDEEYQRSIGARRIVEDKENELRGHITKTVRLTTAIENLDQLKYKKLKEVPIDGLDMVLDKFKRPVITIHGVPFDSLNSALQITLAINFVSYTSGALPLILCEVIDLDPDRMLDLINGAKEAGLQLVGARWKRRAPLGVQDESVYAEELEMEEKFGEWILKNKEERSNVRSEDY